MALFQHFLNGFFQHVGRHHRLETKDGLAVLGNQELAEVPTDGIALVEARACLLMNLVKHGRKLFGTFGITLERCLFLEVSVERTFILSIDINYVKQREGDVISQRAEALVPGSWPRNWLQGKARISRPWSLYF